MNNRSTRSNDDSFPFAGLFASLLVVAIIVGAMSFVFNPTRQTRASVLRGEFPQIQIALNFYIDDCGGPPTAAQGLAALIRNPGVTGWSGPYIGVSAPAAGRLAFTDPWGTPYRYVVLGGLPIVSSAGPDGAFGTPEDLPSTHY